MNPHIHRLLDEAFAGIAVTPDTQDLKEEVRTNLLARVNELEAAGAAPDDAAQRAIAELGDLRELVGEDAAVLSSAPTAPTAPARESIVQLALRAHGFEVRDLGVDVPPQVFVEEAVAWRPDIVGLSGLLTTVYEPMRETVRLLKSRPEFASSPVPVIIGGGTLNEQVRAYVGADYWCNDALAGVRLCQQIITRGNTTEGTG